MKLVGAPRDFSTIRYEGSFSKVKQKSYHNFLNLPLTVANYHAFRESLNQLFLSPALFPCSTISFPLFVKCFNIPELKLEFPPDTFQCTSSTVSFHGSVFKHGDLVSFFKTGIVFHLIREIVLSYPANANDTHHCELENTFFVCNRVDYQFQTGTNTFRLISYDESNFEVFRATDMASLHPISLFHNIILPSTIGRVPGRYLP